MRNKTLNEDLDFWIGYYSEGSLTKIGEVLVNAKNEITSLEEEIDKLSKTNEVLTQITKGIVVHDSQTR